MPKVTALIINQDGHIAARIKEILLSANKDWDIVHVTSATKALRLLRFARFDLLIVTDDLAELDGWRFTRLIRSGILNCKPDIPVIMTGKFSGRIAHVTARENRVNGIVSNDEIEKLINITSNMLNLAARSMRKTTVLVVEDQKDTSDLIVRVLSSAYDLEVAADGKEGLDLWKNKRHDLVLLDVMLPTMSGREILKSIRNLDSRQPIVIMTAHTTIEEAEELMLLGAVDFLPKPFKVETMRQVCDIAIHRNDYLDIDADVVGKVAIIAEEVTQNSYLLEAYRDLIEELDAIIVELDADFRILHANPAWENTLGLINSSSLGNKFDCFVAEKYINTFIDLKARLSNESVVDDRYISCLLGIDIGFGKVCVATFKIKRLERHIFDDGCGVAYSVIISLI